ncbi:hypothetical protein PENSPDRAFT_350425 [Peniophora sp. CONT]|nr:hypothetical protein PENSPDRAFT_350425 [Peniophora sp. CONT]
MDTCFDICYRYCCKSICFLIFRASLRMFYSARSSLRLSGLVCLCQIPMGSKTGLSRAALGSTGKPPRYTSKTRIRQQIHKIQSASNVSSSLAYPISSATSSNHIESPCSPAPSIAPIYFSSPLLFAIASSKLFGISITSRRWFFDTGSGSGHAWSASQPG